ncbi:helix-turn-helix domain-containing protein [Parachryseolinea silvisoli]|uniref:helix-turn-helix domain-containing protein n=1 Tax=Parachryseolinea silvisoli TaxID=2873601 RepID=UPI00226582C4|nr:response regulator transcription factor [Parachryseolinea silvisoli]MCD9017681.1 helix-turn-helix transcriptional regulator [Parachryseolinea silvisoli]
MKIVSLDRIFGMDSGEQGEMVYTVALIVNEQAPRGNTTIYSDAASGDSIIFLHSKIDTPHEIPLEGATGFAYEITDEYLASSPVTRLMLLRLLNGNSHWSYQLDAAEKANVRKILERISSDLSSDYRFKKDLVRTYILELIHYVAKIASTSCDPRAQSSKLRITQRFLSMLEAQFSLTATSRPSMQYSASDFAEHLCVHVNHLNRSVKAVTGKTTSRLISERLLKEACRLLAEGDRTIADVGYSLGFDQPAHFTNFFKRLTGQPPSRLQLADRSLISAYGQEEHLLFPPATWAERCTALPGHHPKLRVAETSRVLTLSTSDS